MIIPVITIVPGLIVLCQCIVLFVQSVCAWCYWTFRLTLSVLSSYSGRGTTQIQTSRIVTTTSHGPATTSMHPLPLRLLCCFMEHGIWLGTRVMPTPECSLMGELALQEKVKGRDICYNAACVSQTQEQQHFAISKVAADWHELMIPQCIMWMSIACTNGHLDLRCS